MVGGASTSAIGGTWMWVPAPITSTVATTQRVSVPSSLATSSQSIPVPTPSHALTSTAQMVPIPVVSSTLDTSHMAVPGSQTQMVPIPSVSVPVSNVPSNSFSFPLHNVFDRISPDEFPLPRPVLEVVFPIVHADVHPVEVMRSHQTSPEELLIPTVNDATDSLFDGVEHYHVRPRELVESLKGAHESVPHASPVEHDDMNEVSAEFFQNHADDLVEQEVEHPGSRSTSHVGCPMDPPVASLEASARSLDGEVEDDISIQNGTALPVVTEIHISARIQQDLELWRRVKEYDQKYAEVPFIPVLTRKQKQHLKKTTIGKPYKTRSTCVTSDQ